MTIKVVILKSKETLICDLKENDNEYIMNYPRKVESINYNEKTKILSVSYESWCNLSYDEHISISKDWIVSILNPHHEIIVNYTDAILKFDQENDESVTSNS